MSYSSNFKVLSPCQPIQTHSPGAGHWPSTDDGRGRPKETNWPASVRRRVVFRPAGFKLDCIKFAADWPDRKSFVEYGARWRRVRLPLPDPSHKRKHTQQRGRANLGGGASDEKFDSLWIWWVRACREKERKMAPPARRKSACTGQVACWNLKCSRQWRMTVQVDSNGLTEIDAQIPRFKKCRIIEASLYWIHLVSLTWLN